MDATHQKETYKFMDVPPFFNLANFFMDDTESQFLSPQSSFLVRHGLTPPYVPSLSQLFPG